MPKRKRREGRLSLTRYLRTYRYKDAMGQPRHLRRLHRFCLKHLASVLLRRAQQDPARLQFLLARMDWTQRGLVLQTMERPPDDALAASLRRCSVPRTTLHKCRRCGSDRTDYYQLQLRSADEPMTSFFRCEACGHRWTE
jgi:hypothetical protein